MSDQPIRVRVMKPLPKFNLRQGQAAWVSGTGIEKLIEDGFLEDITRRAQRSRVWKVSGTIYTDKAKADRVAEALGQVAVEIA